MTEQNNSMVELLTADELAAVLKVSRKFIEEHTQAGHIPGQIKIGRVWRYHKATIQRTIIRGGQFLLLPELKPKN